MGLIIHYFVYEEETNNRDNNTIVSGVSFNFQSTIPFMTLFYQSKK